MSGWAFAAAANSGAGSNWRVSCSSADSALSWVAGSVTASSLGRQSQMAETRRLGAELVYVRNSSTCGNSAVAETRASGWLRGANGKLSSLACRATGDVRRERQGAESQRPRRPRGGRRGLWAPLAPLARRAAISMYAVKIVQASRTRPEAVCTSAFVAGDANRPGTTNLT